MKPIHLTHVAGLALAATVASAETPELVVYTYDSFASEWGPGPAIEAGFEAVCGCDLRLIPAGDGAALLARLELEGSGTEADVILGLDTNLTERARGTGLFAPHGLSPALDLPVGWSDAEFLPYDWGWFAFVGRADGPAPASFAELAASDISIVIQDPRSSTPGLGLLLWIEAAHGEAAAEVWEGLADNVLTVTPGWSEAYNLFLEGEADAVLSYTTSPAYHLIAEGDDGKVAWIFEEGHYLQIEVAGLVAGSDRTELGQAFLEYLTSEEAQAVIPTTNWMYPAIALEGGLPEGFDLFRPGQSLLFDPAEAAARRGSAVETWRAALSR